MMSHKILRIKCFTRDGGLNCKRIRTNYVDDYWYDKIANKMDVAIQSYSYLCNRLYKIYLNKITIPIINFQISQIVNITVFLRYMWKMVQVESSETSPITTVSTMYAPLGTTTA